MRQYVAEPETGVSIVYLPQDAFRVLSTSDTSLQSNTADTQLENLAVACWYCNLKKGPNLAGIDPESGNTVALFKPRKMNGLTILL